MTERTKQRLTLTETGGQIPREPENKRWFRDEDMELESRWALPLEDVGWETGSYESQNQITSKSTTNNPRMANARTSLFLARDPSGIYLVANTSDAPWSKQATESVRVSDPEVGEDNKRIEGERSRSLADAVSTDQPAWSTVPTFETGPLGDPGETHRRQRWQRTFPLAERIASYPRGYVRVPDEIFHLGLEPISLRLYVHILGRQISGNEYYESIDHAAAFLGWNRTTVIRHLQHLEDKDLIHRQTTLDSTQPHRRAGSPVVHYRAAHAPVDPYDASHKLKGEFSLILSEWLVVDELTNPFHLRLLLEYLRRSHEYLFERVDSPTGTEYRRLNRKAFRPSRANRPDRRPSPPLASELLRITNAISDRELSAACMMSKPQVIKSRKALLDSHYIWRIDIEGKPANTPTQFSFLELMGLLDPSVLSGKAGSRSTDQIERFQALWRQSARDVNGFPTVWTERDVAITSRLLHAHGFQVLSECIMPFWWRHSRTMRLFDGNQEQMVAFARRLPEIMREIEPA